MLAPTVTNSRSPIHGQSIEVVFDGQEHDGPTTVHEGDLFFYNKIVSCYKGTADAQNSYYRSLENSLLSTVPPEDRIIEENCTTK
jgi:hypothetical protein